MTKQEKAKLPKLAQCNSYRYQTSKGETRNGIPRSRIPKGEEDKYTIIGYCNSGYVGAEIFIYDLKGFTVARK